jgi:hypothetical protein
VAWQYPCYGANPVLYLRVPGMLYSGGESHWGRSYSDKIKVSTALPLCPHCAFMGWTRTAFTSLTLLNWFPYSSSKEVDDCAWEELSNERLDIFIKKGGLWLGMWAYVTWQYMSCFFALQFSYTYEGDSCSFGIKIGERT